MQFSDFGQSADVCVTGDFDSGAEGDEQLRLLLVVRR